VLSTGLLAICAPGGSVAGAAAATAPTAPVAALAAAQDDATLRVSMNTLTPSVIPRRGKIIITGEVTNTSDKVWADLQVYMLTSQTPIGDRADLAAAAASDPTTYIGERLAEDGQFTEIGDLAPDESTPYAVSVNRKDLEISEEPGVYWIGVHILGAGDGPRDLVADGRARSFIPMMEADAPRARVALTVPVREPVLRDTDNRLLYLRRWERSLDSGRLERLLSFGASSSRPITWIVDPAVADAAATVAADNPPLSVTDDGSGPQEEGEDPEESPGGSVPPGPDPAAGSPTASGSDSAEGEQSEQGDSESDEEPGPEALAAQAWLDSLAQQADRTLMMSVPYGDLDVAAVTDNRLPKVLAKAGRLGASVMAALGVDSDPVIAPPTGYLPGRSMSRLDDDIPVLISDEAMPDAEGPLLTRQNGVDVALVDSAASDGGPGPNTRRDPLALRQRILADAALHALSSGADGLGQGDQPLIVGIPEDWGPGADWQQADFFGGLDVPWLQQVDLRSVLARGPGPVNTALPVYPLAERRSHIPFANLLATKDLVRTGSTYAELLTFNDTVRDELAETAMLGSSYGARSRPARALNLTRSLANQVRLIMDRVVVEVPSFVMLSSDTGPIAVTLTNNLDETVTVRIEALTGNDGLSIVAPAAITLGPAERTLVRLRADSTNIGLRSVTLRATTEEGIPIGTQVRVSVRSSNVGLVIWVVMGVGGAIFLLAVAARIRRRIRDRGHRRGRRGRRAATGTTLAPTGVSEGTP